MNTPLLVPRHLVFLLAGGTLALLVACATEPMPKDFWMPPRPRPTRAGWRFSPSI